MSEVSTAPARPVPPAPEVPSAGVPHAADRLRLAAAAALFSTGGAAIKATTLTAWQVASFRSGVAAVAVLLLVPAARRGFSPRVLLVALAYAATMVLFVASNKTTTAANAIFLQSAAPLYVLVLAPWLLKERATRGDVGVMAIIAAGLALVITGAPATTATAPDPGLGDVLALLSGASWALTLIGLRWLGAAEGGEQATLSTVVAGNAIACLACLPAALPVLGATTTDWAVVGYLGLFQIGLAYYLLTRGMRGVSAFEASVLLLIEPALNPLWAWLVHGERPGLLPIAGGMLILAATLVRARR
jgi:DME family drug/metabolite transporter